ncbi:hypothetical protein [Flavobacterium branchiicola]|uniref:Cytochrome C and Quinol oxidase polypeptide I n=1 Tax=Flavobacterium branchiicola TaxID=1114875 RepID=A0ABV9PGL4_9FLAO|nr:hypothetical protein [Flavobacterium branchiicola]MBS7255701.1 hypothetical protein [Flavobacterium branchiicola]
MKYIKSKPYILFLAVIIIVLSFGFYKGREDVVINIYDTYFIISYKHLAILLSVVYGFLALLYFGLSKLNFKLFNWITIFHISVSIIGLFAIFILSKLVRENVPGDMTTFWNNINFNEKIEYGIGLSIILIIGAQILFLINVTYALVKKII